jgi:elongation factor G
MSGSTDLVRNVAITGHGSTGKTTLLEHLLFAGGAIAKPETIDSGKTVSDYQDEEIQRKISVHASLSHVSWKDRKINFLDTPGSSDFVGDVILAFRSCELALVLLDGRSGVQIETIKSWRSLDARGLPRAVFVSRLDEERSDYTRSLADVKEKFKASPVPLTIPMGQGSSFKGVIDVLARKAYLLPASHDQKESAADIPAEFHDEAEAARAALAEAAAEGDDALMEASRTRRSSGASRRAWRPTRSYRPSPARASRIPVRPPSWTSWRTSPPRPSCGPPSGPQGGIRRSSSPWILTSPSRPWSSRHR